MRGTIRLLGVLARTTEELTLTTLADLSDVSLAHVARVVPRLVELGVVERREVPPAVLVRLSADNLRLDYFSRSPTFAMPSSTSYARAHATSTLSL